MGTLGFCSACKHKSESRGSRAEIMVGEVSYLITTGYGWPTTGLKATGDCQLIQFRCHNDEVLHSLQVKLDRKTGGGRVTEKVLARLGELDDEFILVNFANPDMVGHTGVLEAAIAAAGVVDTQLGRLCEAVLSKGGALLITADHGNSEQMLDEAGKQPHTAHTLNPVPVILVDDDRRDVALRNGGALRDLAPTALELMGIPVPVEMDGRSLIAK